MDMLQGKTLVTKSGDEVAADERLKDIEVIAYYFSAHWCPPCRGFTPVLADFYSELKDNSEKFEIVFVSSDHSQADMMSYLKEDHGDWVAVPHDDPLVGELKQKFSLRGIPTLVVVKRDGSLVTTDGRSQVQKDGTGCYKLWAK